MRRGEVASPRLFRLGRRRAARRPTPAVCGGLSLALHRALVFRVRPCLRSFRVCICARVFIIFRSG